MFSKALRLAFGDWLSSHNIYFWVRSTAVTIYPRCRSSCYLQLERSLNNIITFIIFILKSFGYIIGVYNKITRMDWSKVLLTYYWLHSKSNHGEKHWTRKKARVSHKYSLLAENVLEKYIALQKIKIKKKIRVVRKLG